MPPPDLSSLAADVQPVLRCGQCNKPFDKQATLKRHLYYCRSQRTGNIARSRSCVACARGKIACDKSRPRCSRCIAKFLNCHYPSNTTRSVEAKTPRNGDAPIEPGTVALASASSSFAQSHRVDGAQEPHDGGDMSLHDALAIISPGNPNLGDGYMEWNNANISFTDLFNNMQTDELSLSLSPPPLTSHSTPSAQQTALEQQRLRSHELLIPTQPTSAVRSLIQRPKTQPGTQRISNLIFHTLNSYPLMMLRYNTLPPFIHPMTVSSNVEDPHMWPLTNCMSLVHMIAGGVQGSQKLFWKNVQLECERLSHEHEKLHKWELLAAMQALSIYILRRLVEGETDYNNLDSLLLKTFIAVAKQIGQTDVTCHRQCGLCDHDLQLGWKEWIFRESRRRLAIIYRVVNMLVYFEPAAMCDMPTEFILAPLPARRQLWEATNEFSWKTENQRLPGPQVSFGLAADGELVELDEGRLSCSDAWLSCQSTNAKASPRSAKNWEEWCAGIDGFSGLVILAASLTM